MEDITDNNKAFEDGTDADENYFSYNCIDIPWDDRAKRSKIFIVLLLLTIFIATMALVINNFAAHYENFNNDESFQRGEINCNLVKLDEYPYVARIHLVSSQQLICIGAVVSESSVLANEVCVKSGPVHLHVGSSTEQRCKKGFSVGAVELIPHDGVVSKYLVLLSTYKKMSICASIARIGAEVHGQSHAFIIGRPFRGERSLSRQLVTLPAHDNYTDNGLLIDNLRHNNVFCVKYLSRCPVRAGDLLVQRGRLLGLASIGMQSNNKVACFANVSTIVMDLKQLDVNID